MKALALFAALAATTLCAAPTHAAEGHTYYTSHGIYATIISENAWNKNGFSGYDAWININGRRTLFGVVCQDLTRSGIGPSVREMDWDGRTVVRDAPIVPYARPLRGIAGFMQDTWHNVCEDDDSY